MGRAILEIKDIQKSFALNFSTKKNAGIEYRNVLENLNLEIERGQVTALVGGNGAGKTTLFNLVSGLLKADSGTILFFGHKKTLNCTRVYPWETAAAGIGRLFQAPKVFDSCTVLEHLMLQGTPANLEWPFRSMIRHKKFREKRRKFVGYIEDALAPFAAMKQLLENPDIPASSLSYAQQRLLSLAGLIVGGYELLLLDEPSSGLSEDSIITLNATVNHLKQEGKSIFIIEHNMEVVRNLADQCHYLSEGCIKHSGSAEAVLSESEVLQSYLL
ncbi:MAG TPA: ATP-binding cassette domain-containing protein [Bacteroidales bacterium]|nr:ATP-binding cassette domain-containing protein [Bacteroidales bacterium]